MSPYAIQTGDVKEVLSGMEGQFDGCLTDPPYGLSFMGKSWDHGVPSADVWAEVYRVLKPGAFLLAFGGTRTFHRLTCAIEDAGFEIRDCVMWLYGSGFPKSHNWDKDGAFKGYGTALKPAWEPCIVAMKPLDGTFANNAMKHGVAGINVDAGRISGRWPANLILDESFNQGWSRFFYCAKASKRDRDEGLEGFEAKNNMRVNGPRESEEAKHSTLRANHHPTVKPTDLMRYLCRLVTPPGGTVLDPFCGSGSTLKGAELEGFSAIGVELHAEHVAITKARLGVAVDAAQAAALHLTNHPN